MFNKKEVRQKQIKPVDVGLSFYAFFLLFYNAIILLCIDNLFSSIKCNINMATDIVLTYNIIEACLVEL